MSFRQEWKALSARIHGLLNAGRFFYDTPESDRNEQKTTMKEIFAPRVESLFSLIETYGEIYRPSLSEAAVKCIEKFICDYSAIKKYKNKPGKPHGIKTSYEDLMLTLLAAFEGEFTYHLSDIQAIAKRTVERTFIHLQSSIAADEKIRATWKTAYKKGEVECEKLGAAHLLLHGIWAFKANATGGRTDLVLGESMLNTNKVEETADAMVLTEWKKVDKPSNHSKIAEAAFRQAKIYSEGILAGIELSGFRYLVLVSEKQLPEIPDDIKDSDITYRYINIAVNPETPSAAAKRSR